VHDDIAAVGDADGLREILLGHQHGEMIVILELFDGVDGARDQQRREADRGLVHQQDARRQHQRAGERQHLLLAAAHGAGELIAPFGQAGERLEAEIKIGLDLRARLRPEGAQQQIFFYRQFREQPAAFRHQRDAEIDDLLGSHSDQVMLLAVDFRDDAAFVRAHDAHDAFHQRAFAVAIGAEQSHGLAGLDADRHVMDHAHRAIGGVYVFDGEATGQDTPSPLARRAPRLPACHRRPSYPTPARPAAARSSSPRS
jgi:hypothetical protein